MGGAPVEGAAVNAYVCTVQVDDYDKVHDRIMNAGGINTSKHRMQSDAHVNGMLLNYACYFHADESRLRSVIDFLIANQLHDGGFNYEANRAEAVTHSSLHTTLSVLDGLHEYRTSGCTYRLHEIEVIEKRARESVLMHKVFISDRTSKIIDRKFLHFTYPFRWRYTILRAMDYFRSIEYPYDARMGRALQEIHKKRNRTGGWDLRSKFPGAEHFAMEQAGLPSRWRTPLALRVLRHYANESPRRNPDLHIARLLRQSFGDAGNELGSLDCGVIAPFCRSREIPSAGGREGSRPPAR